MKVYKVIIFLIFFGVGAVKAQTIDITGTVKDEEGQPVHFTFVKDVETKTAIYTDSLGNFFIKAKPNSSLYISCFGYRDTVVKIESRVNMAIILKPAVTVSASKTTLRPQPTIGDASVQQLTATMARDQVAGAGSGISSAPQTVKFAEAPAFKQSANIVDAAQGAIFPQFNPKEETQGSRYLLKGWIHGYVINKKDSVVEDPSYLFEYDKMGGALLLTKNQVSAIEVDRDMVKSFILFDNGNMPYVFENVPQISNSHYVQVLASGDNYKIYKAIKNTFEKANYSTDGLYATGHNYDLYTDEFTYYLYNVKTNTLQEITLKKKAIKAAFTADADKLNKFMSDHSSDSIDEMYLEELGASLNE